MKEVDLKQNYYPNLDGFRFLAFYLVFLNHAFTINEYSKFPFNLLEVSFLKNGASGVSFFFVLSGFLITDQILAKQSTLKFSLRNFYIRRIIRIWPLYFACLFITYTLTIVVPLGKILSTADFHWSYWMFLSNFHIIEKIHEAIAIILPLDITWSISIEEQFYLIWPLFFIIVKRKTARIIGLALMIIFSLGFRVYFREDHAMHYFHSISALYELSLGGLLAVLTVDVKSDNFDELRPVYIKGVYMVGILWVLLNGEQYLFEDGRFLQPLFFAFVIFEQCFSAHSFYKLGHYRIISSLGKYTYAMYLLHPLSLWATQLVFLYFKAHNETVVASVGFVITVLASIFTYHFFEQKILRLKKHFQ